MGQIRNFIKDILRYLPAQIIPAVVGFITIPIVTRLFSPTDYGNYALVLTTIGIFSTLTGWLSIGIIRFYYAYESDNKLEVFYSTTIKWLFISEGIFVALFCGALLLGRNYIAKDLYKLMFSGVLVFVCFSSFQILSTLLRVKRSVNWYSFIFVWKSIISLAAGLILILIFKVGIEGLLWGTILSILLVFPWLWKKAVGKISLKKMSKSLTQQMAKYSFPLVLANLSFYILDLSDRYVLNAFRGAQEVGVYSISYAISGKTILIGIVLFSLAVEPLNMHIWENQGERETQIFTTQITRYFLIMLIPAVIGLSVLATPIFALITTEKYYLGYQVLPLIAMSVFLLGLSQRFGQGLNFYKKTVYDMWSIAIAALTNLGLNFIFIPKYGYMAAGITTLIGYSIMLILRIYFSKKFFIWRFPFQTLFRCTMAAIIMGTGVNFLVNELFFSLTINLILGILCGIIFYLLLLFLFKEIRSEERQVMRNFVRQKLL